MERPPASLIERRASGPRARRHGWDAAVRCLGVLLAASLRAAGASAQAEPWTLFGGSFANQWRTLGQHGHFENCKTRDCDDQDLSRANLDASIGYRAGAERAFVRRGRIEALAGGEANLLFTEFNRSQRGVRIGAIFGVIGLRIDARLARLLVRGGAGAAGFDDGRGRVASFVEAAAELPLGGGVAVRIGARRAEHGGPTSDEVSVVLVSNGAAAAATAPWRLSWSAGLSDPGRGVGKHLSLSTAPFSRLSLHLQPPGSRNRLGLSFLATAHESRLQSPHFGVPGNERGNTVEGFGLLWDREAVLLARLQWRYGAGIEIANWSDDFPLLSEGSARPVFTGLEPAITARLEAVAPIRRRLWFLFGAEKAYWPGIRLGELRLRVGVEISP